MSRSPESSGIAPLIALVMRIYDAGLIVDEFIPVHSNNVHESAYIHHVARIGKNARFAVSTFPVTMNVFVCPPLTRKIGSLSCPKESSALFVGMSEALRYVTPYPYVVSRGS